MSIPLFVPILTKVRQAGLLLSLLLGTLAGPACAQYATGSGWGLTELDSIVSVRTPYRGEPTRDETAPWFASYTTSSYSNRFEATRLDLNRFAQQQATDKSAVSGVSLDMNKVFRALLKSRAQPFGKAKLKAEYAVSLPSAPEGYAMHRTYSGYGTIAEKPASMEIIWFARQGVVYVFFCTTVGDETQQASEERQRFFSTITVGKK